MKQAYLITAYKNFDELYELAEILSKTAYVFIHVDEKSREITDADVEKLNRLPGCEASREYRIVWGGFAHVQAIVKLIAMALSKEDVSYMHLLTGEDFPLLTPEQLDEKFLASDQIYMDYLTPEQLPETVTKRSQNYNWFTDQNVKNKVLWQLQNMTVKVQKKAGICRKGIGSFTKIYKGLVYVSMPREAAAYVVSFVAKHGEFWDDLAVCQVPEEFFFQTIFMNDKNWREHVVNKQLRYMDWTKGDGSSPAYLTLEDYDKVKASGCAFARKFHPKQSEILRDRLREDLGIES